MLAKGILVISLLELVQELALSVDLDLEEGALRQQVLG